MEYTDLNGYPCRLSFERNTFSLESRHVLVICKVDGNWLLTDHPSRGLEFPGGKVEHKESLEEAAKREVHEETGAIVDQLEWVAEYMVYSPKPFCKTVFAGVVDKVEEIPLLETKGIRLTKNLALDETYSFLMKDAGMREIVKKVKQLGKWTD